MRNKPNFRSGASDGKCFMRKWLWRIRPARSCEKTKPISTSVPIGRSAFPGAIVRNKPNFWWPGYPTIPVFYSIIPPFQSGGCCAKQTQSAPAQRNRWGKPTLPVGAIAPNKPNSARPAGRPGPWEGKSCETKPIFGPTDARDHRQAPKTPLAAATRIGVGEIRHSMPAARRWACPPPFALTFATDRNTLCHRPMNRPKMSAGLSIRGMRGAQGT